MKRILVLFCTLFALTLTGCQELTPPTETDDQLKTDEEEDNINTTYVFFSDATDTQKVLPVKPKNVAVLDAGLARVWQIAEGTVNITVQETIDKNVMTSDDAVITVGTASKVNEEMLLSAHPDLVIMKKDAEVQGDLVKTLENKNIPVLQMESDGIDEYVATLRAFCRLTKSDAYKEKGYGQIDTVNDIKSKVPAGASPNVLILNATNDRMIVLDSANKIGEMLLDLGATNIADEDASLSQLLTAEAVSKHNVQQIFIYAADGNERLALAAFRKLIQSDPAWKAIPAVALSHYIVLPAEWFNSPVGENWANQYAYLAWRLYPTIFEQPEQEEETKESENKK